MEVLRINWSEELWLTQITQMGCKNKDWTQNSNRSYCEPPAEPQKTGAADSRGQLSWCCWSSSEPKAGCLLLKPPPSLIWPLGWAEIPSWTDQDTWGHSFDRTDSFFFSRLDGTSGHKSLVSCCSFHLPQPGHTHAGAGHAAICPRFTHVHCWLQPRTDTSLSSTETSGALTCKGQYMQVFAKAEFTEYKSLPYLKPDRLPFRPIHMQSAFLYLSLCFANKYSIS